ncbi:peptidoglycan-binding protein [Sulfobacillus sp. hq2]|uniref:peptidoglycan-binding domain-containing protein n=1 Tax=Sulfobacillus TaxID=28033 RepID=UPI000CD09875|nr:peptidoglycan-binding protein [Sulfobacillus sp. hq2]POB11595.1 peptidoglycan-binding protein [Sulfobacillus sp. hq2]
MALFDETFAPYVPFGSRVLSVGALGTDVAVLQAVYNVMIQAMNPPQGALGEPIAITGRFDDMTAVAVANIQEYFGLRVDNVVGPQTYWAYGQGVGPYTPYGGPAYGSRELKDGMYGGDVMILHNRLNCFRYASLIGGASDTFTPRTVEAVAAFKIDAENNGDTGFPPNGIAGFGFYDASWLYAVAGGRSLSLGRKGFDVVFVQVLLQNLGFYGGRITGYFNDEMVVATKHFQEAVHIAADGIIGPVTYFHIGKNNAVAAPSPLSIAWPPAVKPQVSVCSAPLMTVTSDLHPYGSASLVINELEGFESLDVVANFVPAPQTFGKRFQRYFFTLTNPVTGNLVVTTPMFLTSAKEPPQDWAGSYSPGVSTIPLGVVTVRAGTVDGVLGPAVLSANLHDCH